MVIDLRPNRYRGGSRWFSPSLLAVYVGVGGAVHALAPESRTLKPYAFDRTLVPEAFDRTLYPYAIDRTLLPEEDD